MRAIRSEGWEFKPSPLPVTLYFVEIISYIELSILLILYASLSFKWGKINTFNRNACCLRSGSNFRPFAWKASAVTITPRGLVDLFPGTTASLHIGSSYVNSNTHTHTHPPPPPPQPPPLCWYCHQHHHHRHHSVGIVTTTTTTTTSITLLVLSPPPPPAITPQ